MVSKSIHQDQTIEKARISFGFNKLRHSRTASPAKVINGIESELARMQDIITNEEPDITISPKSTAALFAFFKTYQINDVPHITVKDSGDLRAIWLFGEGQRLGLSFLSNDTINFVLLIKRDGQEDLVSVSKNGDAEEIYNLMKSNDLPCV